MTNDLLHCLGSIIDAQESKVRWFLRLESLGICMFAAMGAEVAFSLIRRDTSPFVRTLNLASFTVQVLGLRATVGEWRISRRMLRDIARLREQLELERIARL